MGGVGRGREVGPKVGTWDNGEGEQGREGGGGVKGSKVS